MEEELAGVTGVMVGYGSDSEESLAHFVNRDYVGLEAAREAAIVRKHCSDDREGSFHVP